MSSVRLASAIERTVRPQFVPHQSTRHLASDEEDNEGSGETNGWTNLMGAFLVLIILSACVVAVYRTRLARAEREAERQWFAEEQSWWAALRGAA
jgi:hypothetical protein